VDLTELCIIKSMLYPRFHKSNITAHENLSSKAKITVLKIQKIQTG